MCDQVALATGPNDGPMMLFWNPEDGIDLDPMSSRGSRVAALRRVDDQLQRESELAAEQRRQEQEQQGRIQSRSH